LLVQVGAQMPPSQSLLGQSLSWPQPQDPPMQRGPRGELEQSTQAPLEPQTNVDVPTSHCPPLQHCPLGQGAVAGSQGLQVWPLQTLPPAQSAPLATQVPLSQQPEPEHDVVQVPLSQHWAAPAGVGWQGWVLSQWLVQVPNEQVWPAGQWPSWEQPQVWFRQRWPRGSWLQSVQTPPWPQTVSKVPLAQRPSVLQQPLFGQEVTQAPFWQQPVRHWWVESQATQIPPVQIFPPEQGSTQIPFSQHRPCG
jgi:hypothetical protein